MDVVTESVVLVLVMEEFRGRPYVEDFRTKLSSAKGRRGLMFVLEVESRLRKVPKEDSKGLISR